MGTERQISHHTTMIQTPCFLYVLCAIIEDIQEGNKLKKRICVPTWLREKTNLPYDTFH